MINTQLNSLIAQQRTDELRRTAERDRLAGSIDAGHRAPAAKRRLARLRPAFFRGAPLAATESSLVRSPR